eukprot:7437846-Pyramimonas_sp.AAC.1
MFLPPGCANPHASCHVGRRRHVSLRGWLREQPGGFLTSPAAMAASNPGWTGSLPMSQRSCNSVRSAKYFA